MANVCHACGQKVQDITQDRERSNLPYKGANRSREAVSLLYEPLDVESYEVRMLTICPGPPGTIVRCTLEKESLFRLCGYAALSYCWGDETIQRDVIVNKTRTPVTVNLEEALQQLRQMDITRVWVDALCINQLDKQEKNLQVRHMKQIYARSDVTYAWLGTSDVDAAMNAIQFLRNISTNAMDLDNIPHAGQRDDSSRNVWDRWRRRDLSSTQTESSCLEPMPGPTSRPMCCGDQCQRCVLESGFRDLVEFFDRDFWRRRWVIQEVTAAAQVQVICGAESLNLQHLRKALDRCLDSKFWVTENELSYYYMKRILDFRASYHTGHGITLCEAVLATRDFLSKDPRDKVFALVGVCVQRSQLSSLFLKACQSFNDCQFKLFFFE